MDPLDFIKVRRDVDALLIPTGTPVVIPEGTEVRVTQELGGSFTVAVGGNLARVEGRDADALGLQPQELVPPGEKKKKKVAGPVDEQAVWRALQTCYDPEIPVNIVDLGLVYDLRIRPTEDGGNRVDVVMTLTAPGCGMGPVIVEDVRQKVLAVDNVTEAEVELVFDPPWDRSMMSEEAKLQLGMF